MKSETKKPSIIKSAFADKCPNCGQGHVFQKSNNFFELPVMNDKCEVCAYQFDREPGYFIGAMYISYGLAILQGIITFLICLLIYPSISVFWQIIFVALVILLCGKKNYKLARIFYIHIFPW